MRVEALANWIHARHEIWTRRYQGLPKPWTSDPILRDYRFCNVYRELDKVTQWITDNWRTPHRDSKDVWFAMTVARMVNWPDTLEELGYPVPWDVQHFIDVLDRRKAAKEKVFTGVYIVPAKAGWPSKARYIASEVLNPLWCQRDYVYESSDSLAHFFKRLTEFNGMGSFIGGQVVCDTKYTKMLELAQDWWEFACPGPGSRRGLARVYERPVDYPWKDDEWLVDLLLLKTRLGAYVGDLPPIHAQDLQNCLCEFDKYERVRLGEGRPRNNYAGKE